MPEEYTQIVQALKSLTQGEAPNVSTLQMTEDEWRTRPDTVSYGIVSLDFESNRLEGDDVKKQRAHECSVDLFSLVKGGAGWVELIEETLTAYCGANWTLNSRSYERETALFHWEWVFEVS